MIKYMNNCNDHNFLCNTNSKIYIHNYLIYKYVDFYSEIYLGYIILCLYRIYIIKHMFQIFTSEGHF